MNETVQLRDNSFFQQPLPWMAERFKTWKWAIVLAVLFVYAAGISSFWWIGGDSGLYLNLASNLVHGKGYTLADKVHTLVPPGFPLLLAAMMKLGLGSIVMMNAAMCLMGLATVVIVFNIFRGMVHPHWALLVTAVFALSNEMLQRSGELLSDVPCMLLIMTALWLILRDLHRPGKLGGMEAASLLLVLSCYLRVAAVPLVIGVAIGLFLAGWRSQRLRSCLNVVAILLAIAISMLVARIYIHAHAEASTAVYGIGGAVFGGVLDFIKQYCMRFYIATGQLSRLFIVQRIPLYLAMAVFIAPIIIGMVRRLIHGERIIVLMIVCYVGALCLTTEIARTRYMLLIFPFLILFFLEGWAYLAARIFLRLRPATPVLVAVTLIVVVLAFNLPLVGRNLYEKHRANGFMRQQGGMWSDTIKAGKYLRQQQPFEGYLWSSQPVSFLAGAGSPMVAQAIMNRRPDEQGVVEILKQWKVTYAVLDTRKGVMPLDGAIEDFLRARTTPMLIGDKIVVYKVPSLTAGTVTSQIGKATSSAVTANNPQKTAGDGED